MKLLKQYWWVIPVLAVVVYIFILNIKINKLSDEKQLQSVELSTLKDTVLAVVTKNGQLISKVSSVEIDKGNLKESLEIMDIDIKKLKDENIRWKRLNNILQMKLSAAGHVKTTIRDTFRIERTDTVYYSLVKDWSNNYLTLFNAKIEFKELNFDYKYKTGIEIYQEPVKKGTVITVKLADPNAKISSANSITVTPKKRIWDKWWLWAAVGVTGGVLIAK